MLIFSALCIEGVQWYIKFNSSFSNNKIFPVFQAKVMIFHSFLLGSLLCFSAKPFITNRFVWNWFIIVLAVQKASVSLWDKNHGIYIKFWWKYGINVDRLVSNLADKAKLIGCKYCPRKFWWKYGINVNMMEMSVMRRSIWKKMWFHCGDENHGLT